MVSDVETIAPAALAERERVIGQLRERAPQLRRRGVTSLSLFGSMARGDAGPGSDVDLLVETDPNARLGFFEMFDFGHEIETLLGRPVQFAFGSNMRPWLRAWIEDDRIEIF